MSHSLVYYEPFYDFDRLFEACWPASNINNSKLRRHVGDSDGAVRSMKPRMDLHEDTENNKVTATFEFPGLRKEDVNIDLHNGQLTVSAEMKLLEDFEKSGYALRERRVGKVSRTLQLPVGVKDENINASMENGLLTVTFPKTATEALVKKITIS